MANVRDSDTSLWLHNKLGTSNDSWTGSSICSQLNAEVLRNIKDCFPDLQTQVKLKLLLSFFHIPRRNVEENDITLDEILIHQWRNELEEIIKVASLDSELWVSMLSEAMKTFPSTGSLNTDISELDEHRPIFGELVNDLRKLLRKQNDPAMLPLECQYLNKAALTAAFGSLPAPSKHFTLKRKPKSAALRSELVQKSLDASSNIKKSTAPTVPVRSRGMPRKMTDTTPLKGIPSRMPTSGFRPSGLTSSPMTNRTPIASRIGRKDGGIKLLDINEQPMGYAQAKKRKRLQEIEEQQKKAEEAKIAASAPTPATPTTEASTTPEYAQGLAPITTPATPVAAPIAPSTIAAALPQPYTKPISTTVPIAVVAPTPQIPVTSATPVAVVATTPVITAVETPAAPAPTVRPQAVTQITRLTTNPQANTASTRKGLSLTREQMLEAQDMFRTANKVTRPEKALILGFMAGSRDNPCPKLGNIVTVMLSENVEEVIQPDGTTALMQVETHFQMNYTNGEWKRIKKHRRVVNEESTNVVTSLANSTSK